MLPGGGVQRHTMIDCHLHSDYSFDSSMKLEEACESAIRNNLKGIAFTDHLDLEFPGYDNDIIIDFDKYDEHIAKVNSRFEKVLKIVKGIEIGTQPHLYTKTAEIINNRLFDYIIGSVHIIDGYDPYEPGYFYGKSRSNAYRRYLETLNHLLINCRFFDALGHFDFVIRRAPYEDRSIKYSELSDIFDEIFRNLIYNGKCLEINTGSYRDLPDRPAPDFDINILRRYRELGGEMICLGSDAHSPEYPGYKFGYFLNIILNAGFKYLVHFEQRKPVFTDYSL